MQTPFTGNTLTGDVLRGDMKNAGTLSWSEVDSREAALIGRCTAGDEVVGEGWYEYARVGHAEAIALALAGERARGATLYVTLEPCNHTGLTPPCSEAVIAAGVARVVVGARDPNPKAAGGIGQALGIAETENENAASGTDAGTKALPEETTGS